MSIEFKLRRGTTAQHSTFTGAEGEVTVDTTKDTLVVHNGVTPGGNPLLSAADGAVGTANLAANAVTTAKIANSNVTTAKIADANVTYAKMQNVTAGKILGRDTSGDGVVQELPIAVTSGGYVGFGTSTPARKLTAYDTGIFPLSVESNNVDAVALELKHSNSRPWAIAVAGPTSAVGQTPGNFYWYDMTAGVVRAILDTSGNFKFNSGYGSPATAYGCRAWVNFNGTGTVAIRASGNVSSITDNGTGDYTVNFTVAMSDGNYSQSGFARSTGGVGDFFISTTSSGVKSTSQFRVYVRFPTGASDSPEICCNFYR